ncbi:hypothetical protein TPA0598_01_08820 [Streptomyces lydicamycinicus]|uniref:Uncharacterized protein n=1 Tax=Streptomyces lydicamycinicus TaxID=1546107 RepID=A0A0P4R104_9ACTN|nr:hypothetical protein TPA0598_01_08820 [Streptomyces lydicamycinicus]
MPWTVYVTVVGRAGRTAGPQPIIGGAADMAVAAAFPRVRRAAQAVNGCDAGSLPTRSGALGIAVASYAGTVLRATRPYPLAAAR